jgi:hypothetical protein
MPYGMWTTLLGGIAPTSGAARTLAWTECADPASKMLLRPSTRSTRPSHASPSFARVRLGPRNEASRLWGMGHVDTACTYRAAEGKPRLAQLCLHRTENCLSRNRVRSNGEHAEWLRLNRWRCRPLVNTHSASRSHGSREIAGSDLGTETAWRLAPRFPQVRPLLLPWTLDA